MGQPMATKNSGAVQLQKTLVEEESEEFCAAVELESPDYDQLKELADTVFVCYQFAAMRGWDLDEALTRVFESNMSKLVDGKPLRRADGKVEKGPNYQPPYLTDLV